MNLETIHTHDVVAERYGTVGELRAELEGGRPPGATPSCASGSDLRRYARRRLNREAASRAGPQAG